MSIPKLKLIVTSEI
uniref:Uncharacterized protein n=1 Tax=Arundo donax TaxID=35708 RepID=A0A0A9FTJ2_ARUDO